MYRTKPVWASGTDRAFYVYAKDATRKFEIDYGFSLILSNPLFPNHTSM
jgi:hypothetical protein